MIEREGLSMIRSLRLAARNYLIDRHYFNILHPSVGLIWKLKSSC